MSSEQGPLPLADTARIAARIRSYLVENFLLGNGDLASDDSLLDKGIVDSTGVLEVVGFLEEEFEIQVTDDEMVTENLDSVDRLVRFVCHKRALADAIDSAGSD